MRNVKSLAILGLVMSAAILGVLGCKTSDSASSHSSASAAGVRPYPLNTCIVTDEALEAGKSYTFVRDGQEIKLCCKDCLADFNKNPSKYLVKLNK